MRKRDNDGEMSFISALIVALMVFDLLALGAWFAVFMVIQLIKLI